MTRLSVVLATHNEESNLATCLDAVSELADEIVIADEQSEDKTIEIAKKFKARIINSPHQQNFHLTKNIAIDAAKGDWILQLDADEVVSPELAKEIISKINEQNSNLNGYWINRKNWFLTRFLTKGGQYPDPTLRLYRRGKGRLPAHDVHEQAIVDGEVGHLDNDLLHYRDTSFEKYLQGFNRYSSFIAVQMKLKTKINILTAINYLIVKPLITFFMLFIRHRGYVDGMAGLIFALYSGLIHPVAYIKYWQHEKYPA
jgi:glycosyltransferase involved in cell wall biosynthesis